MPIKYIFITGGVISSLGKGLAAASLAKLLESRGIKIAMLKLDPYLNVDPGTMSPFQHGEVYVTDDGTETDLDLGHYFRFTNSPLSSHSNTTTGQIYEAVIQKERNGDFLGKTVQVIPHITDEIKQRIYACASQEKDIQVLFVEIGGTVGDIESLPFLEAIRQFRYDHPQDCINIHLTYVPYIQAAGEMKTKPTQHSVQMLREIGIIPDIILCRCDKPLSAEIKNKISLFCSVNKNAVFEAIDVQNTIYEVPLLFAQKGIDEMLCEKLSLKCHRRDLKKWEKMVDKMFHPKGKVTVAIVGKYLDHQDAYKSVFEALQHAATHFNRELIIKKIESDKNVHLKKELLQCDGCLVPGGFGERGWEGKIEAATICRTKNIPFFGICLGLHVMIVEFARKVLHYAEANSTEFDPSTSFPVIALLEEQKKIKGLGGSMRLGAYPCSLKKSSKAFKAYNKTTISERHRHRYEFNNEYKEAFEKKGMVFSGIFKKDELCEIVEIKNHPWMLGVQFHPEFQSKPISCHPLFLAFVQAMIKAKS
ncbi:MAG: CTP synthase [Parachlamydiales bacterium]|nr:CTP synthase [Parachlamydiales bacterium]